MNRYEDHVLELTEQYGLIRLYEKETVYPDADNDGLTDWDEYKLGTNPNIEDTDADGIIDSEEIIRQSIYSRVGAIHRPEVIAVEVSYATMGNILNKIHISNISQGSFGRSGIIGRLVEVRNESIIDEATIVFYYNEDYLGNTDEHSLAIVCPDEKPNKVHLTESYVDTEKDTVTVVASGFSKEVFALVDSSIYAQYD